MKFIKQILVTLAKKHLGLIEKNKHYIAVRDATNLIEKDKKIESLQFQMHGLSQEMAHVKSKYPSVWLQGDVAQGVMQLPHLKIACEFFREDARLCIFVPWKDAEGRKPTEFVPPWLEVDTEQQISGDKDQMNGNGILYKIPIKGWDDTITLERKLEDDHPTFGLDGKPIEKVRSFTNGFLMHGFYKREEIKENGEPKIFAHLYFFEPITALHRKNIAKLLPKGIIKPAESGDIEETKLNSEITHLRIPVIEMDRQKLGYEKRTMLTGDWTQNSKRI